MAFSIMHTIPSAARTASGAATGMHVGGYEAGILWVRSSAVAGTARFHWECAPGSNLAATGRYFRSQSLGTFSNATGMFMAAISPLGAWGRVAWTLGGTAQATFEAWFIGRTT